MRPSDALRPKDATEAGAGDRRECSPYRRPASLKTSLPRQSAPIMTSSPYTSPYLPPYTTLWSHPPPPPPKRPASPPRRAGAASASAYDARTQVYLAELQQSSQARAQWYHASGVHLPSRSSMEPASVYLDGGEGTSRAAVNDGSGLASGSGAVQGSARNRWRARWSKEDVRMREAAERGWHWSGSGVTQEEEKDLNEEEAERQNYVSPRYRGSLRTVCVPSRELRLMTTTLMLLFLSVMPC